DDDDLLLGPPGTTPGPVHREQNQGQGRRGEPGNEREPCPSRRSGEHGAPAQEGLAHRHQGAHRIADPRHRTPGAVGGERRGDRGEAREAGTEGVQRHVEPGGVNQPRAEPRAGSRPLLGLPQHAASVPGVGGAQEVGRGRRAAYHDVVARKPPKEDVGDRDLRVTRPKREAAGLAGVAAGLGAGLREMGVRRSALTLARVNQPHGFDCPGCAWPEPGHRSPAEFCENGAKAVAEEATLRRVTPEFFARHSISDLSSRTGHWLGQQGRLTEPVLRRAGSDHYEPVSWDEAFDLIVRHLKSLDSPNEAIFYTSGRTSNEAAFCWQLLARAFGTNNLPDCSNMCHESSGFALTETIGVGKGSVSLEDIHAAKLLLVVG